MTDWHYALWAYLACLTLLYVARAAAAPVALFAPPLLVGFGFSGLYVGTCLSEDEATLARFLDWDAYLKLLLLAAASATAFAFGFELAARRRAGGTAAWGPEAPPGGPGPSLCRLYALALTAIAFAALVTFIEASGGPGEFFYAPHGTGGAWSEVSAYLYTLPTLLLPASYLLVAAALSSRSQPPLAFLASAAALGYVAFQAFVFGNRGDTIKLAIIVGLSWATFRAASGLRTAVILAGLLLAVGAVLVLPHLRSAVHLGAERTVVEVFRELAEPGDPGPDAPKVTGNELFFAAAVVKGASETGTTRYGLDWTYVLLNFVPRGLWPDKPYRLDWQFRRHWQLVQESMGFRVAGGSALTGLADTYLQFAWAAPAFWLLVGCMGGGLWRRVATGGRGIADLGLCVGYLFGLVHLVTQSFTAGFYHWFFFSAPIWGLILAHRLTQVGAAHPTTSKRPPPAPAGTVARQGWRRGREQAAGAADRLPALRWAPVRR